MSMYVCIHVRITKNVSRFHDDAVNIDKASLHSKCNARIFLNDTFNNCYKIVKAISTIIAVGKYTAGQTLLRCDNYSDYT